MRRSLEMFMIYSGREGKQESETRTLAKSQKFKNRKTGNENETQRTRDPHQQAGYKFRRPKQGKGRVIYAASTSQSQKSHARAGERDKNIAPLVRAFPANKYNSLVFTDDDDYPCRNRQPPKLLGSEPAPAANLR